MSHSESILEQYFPSSDEQLRMGKGLSATSLAEQFGTPFYAYDANILKQRVQQVRQALSGRINILFALKANSSLAITQLFNREGCGAEIASAGELAVAQAAGVAAKDTHYAGPGKSIEELGKAINTGVGAINVESISEFERICTVATELGKVANTAIRVQPPASLSGSRMRMGGGGQKFGLAADEAIELGKLMQQNENTHFKGLHCYAGTQCFDADAWIGNVKFLIEFADTLETEHGVTVEHLNFGGGFGVPCFDGDKEFDLASAGEQLQNLLADDPHPRRYFVELGRYLCAPAGVYLSSVIETKRVGEQQHIILDGGMHQHSAAAGFGAVIKRSFPMVNASYLASRTPEGQFTKVGGCLCTPADEFASKSTLQAEAGDVVAILMSGAYGWSFSNQHFLGHPTPAEVLIDDDNATLIRAAGKDEDTLINQLALDY